MMNRSSKSVLVFACYLLVMGPLLMIAPDLVLSLLAIPPATGVWIRVVGMLVAIVGYYYLQAARGGWTGLFRASVHARLAVPVFLVAFALLGLAPPQIVLFGLIDAAGAVWTALALRAEAAG